MKGMCVNGISISEGAKRGRYNAMMKVTNADTDHSTQAATITQPHSHMCHSLTVTNGVCVCVCVTMCV